MRRLGILQVILAGACFGTLGIFGKWAYSIGLSVGELLSARFLTAGLLLSIVLLVCAPQKLKLPKRQILNSLLLGALGYASFSSMYFISIEGLSVGLAAMLLFTFPLFVAVFGHFFLKEKLAFRNWGFLFLTLLGLGVLLWSEPELKTITSIFWALGAAITYAAYVIISHRLQPNVHPLSSSVYVMIGAALSLILIHRPDWTVWTSFEAEKLQLLFGIAIVATIAPLSLFLAGLQKLKSSEASILVTVEPLVAAALGFLILKESWGLQQLLGAALVLAGLTLQSLASSK